MKTKLFLKSLFPAMLMVVTVMFVSCSKNSSDDDIDEIPEFQDYVFEATVDDVKVQATAANGVLATDSKTILLSVRINDNQDLLQVLFPSTVKKDDVIALKGNESASITFLPASNGLESFVSTNGVITITEYNTTTKTISIVFNADLKKLIGDDEKVITSGSFIDINYIELVE